MASGAKSGVRLLEEQLGSRPPRGFRALDEPELAALAEAVAAKREAQRAALEAAADEAFEQIPRLLRAPVRKLVLG